MKTSAIHKITEKLDTLTNEELNQIEHVIEAMKDSKEGLHFNARFQGINLDDNGKMTMTLGLQNANYYGVAQGGALYTFADVVLGFYIMSFVSDDYKVLTQELKMNYIKPGRGEKLYAEPTIHHLGKNTAICECKIVDEQRDLVAISLGTFFLKKSEI